jgi:hypothetical protein
MFKILIPLLFLTVPYSLSAQALISEIMYDLSGADDPHEWVEIFNSAASPVDLTDWRFNDGSNHILNTPPLNGGQGSIVLASGAYAVLADDAATFLADTPGFSGVVIDTVMSLANATDTLSLIDGEGAVIDTVSYNSELGGAGDGNSLSRSGNTFVAQAPSPGSGTLSADAGPEEVSGAPEPPKAASEGGSSTSFPVEPQIFADAGTDRVVTVGADAIFEGKARGLKGEPLDGARFVWNFGNGLVKEGQRVLAHYDYPGTYVVFLGVSSGKFSASDRIRVIAEPADIVISRANPELIELWNKTNRDLDLSFWFLAAGGKQFSIPEHTTVLAGSKLIFSGSVTGLTATDLKQVVLLYPSGVAVSSPAQVAPPPTPQVQKVTTAPSSVPTVIPAGLPKVTSSQEAAVALSVNEVQPVERSMMPWLSALGAIIALGVVAIFLLGKREEAEIKILE